MRTVQRPDSQKLPFAQYLCNFEMPFSPSNERTFCRPESTTYTTPGIVNDVSAMLVARITAARQSVSLHVANYSVTNMPLRCLAGAKTRI